MREQLDKIERCFPVWQENRTSIEAFLKVRTQWLTSMGGGVGLNFTAVEAKVKRMNLEPAVEQRVLDDLDVMESAILAAWGEQAKKREAESKRVRANR
jgi:hypothetical protein